MSDFDTAIAGMDDTLFEAFGEETTIQRGAAAAVDVRVVLTRGVTRYGEYGQVVGHVTIADIRNAQWEPKPGDVLHLTAGDRTVESIQSDDGHVTRVVLHG